MTLLEHLQKLTEATQAIDEHNRQGEKLLDDRNTAILDAYHAWARISEICRAIGLTRTTIYRIVDPK